jgi:hypothetical protein
MDPDELIAASLARCPAIHAKTLEDFLDTLLDEDLDVLAQMPGTPGHVMAAQFTHYARSSTDLEEPVKRDTTHSAELQKIIMHVPASGRRAKTRRAATNGAVTPSAQAAA